MFDRAATGRWWDRPWGLVEGCTPCSPGCDRCWARAIERRFGRGGEVRFREDRLEIPLRRQVPTAYAVWNDLFHEAVTDGEIQQAFGAMIGAPQHRFLLLTKRALRMQKYISDLGTYGRLSKSHGIVLMAGGPNWPLPNLWLGVTVCNQAEADEKIPFLLRTPAAVRFVSYEPALGPIDLQRAHALCYDKSGCDLRKIDWLIVGGETGPGARPAHPAWFRSALGQCRAAGVPFFFKGWGAWAVPLESREGDLCLRPDGSSFRLVDGHFAEASDAGLGIEVLRRFNRKRAGRLLAGREWNEIPEAAK